MPYLLSVALLGATCVKSAENTDFPAWAYPRCDRTPPAIEPDSSRPLSVPGSGVRFTAADLARASVAPDWFPPEHPKMPAVVAASRSDKKIACAYCHLPDGSGRPENAKITGLSTAYIIAQVRSIHIQERRPAKPGWGPSALMKDASADLTDEDIAAAAEYFSRQKTNSFVRVLEREYVPQHGVLCGIFIPAEGPAVPLRRAILEMPIDVERFERRDPHATYLTGDSAQPMQPVVASLTQADMIDLAAYAAFLKP
jgi:cytochrome c553